MQVILIIYVLIKDQASNLQVEVYIYLQIAEFCNTTFWQILPQKFLVLLFFSDICLVLICLFLSSPLHGDTDDKAFLLPCLEFAE